MTQHLKRDLKRQIASGTVLSFPTSHNLAAVLVADGDLPRADVLDDLAGLDEREAAAIARLMRTWVSAGQTGCMYAAKLSKPVAGEAAELWSAQVIAERLDDLVFSLVIDNAMRQIGNADILMLVFPYVRDEEGLADLIGQLLSSPDWWWEDRSKPDDRVVKVGLRWLLPDGAHVSWILGFAPMPWLPFTRRAPATALIMRVQPDAHTVAPEELEDGLRGVHLAHLAHGMGPDGIEGGPIWLKTEDRKRTLLWDDLTGDAKLLAARLSCDDVADQTGREVMRAAWNVFAPHAKAKVTFTLQRTLMTRLPSPGRSA